MKKKNPGGRPSTYTPEITDAICARLCDGDSLVTICKDEGMPCLSTVFLWLSKHKEFSDKYAHAKDVGLERMANDMLEIADEPVGSTDTGATDSGAVNKQRLQVDTRKWLLSKLAPKKYGDRQKIEHSGSIGLEALVHDDEAE